MPCAGAFPTPDPQPLEGGSYRPRGGSLGRGARAVRILELLRGPGLCLVILWGLLGVNSAPQGFWQTHPPTHIRKMFRKKMKFIKGARTWRSIFGRQTFFWPLTPPPPLRPGYSINQRLSKGLARTVSANLEATRCWRQCFSPKLYLTLQEELGQCGGMQNWDWCAILSSSSRLLRRRHVGSPKGALTPAILVPPATSINGQYLQGLQR